MIWSVIASVALALWFGGGVVAGFLTPPAAFGILTDRQAAGNIAGTVLTRYAYIAMACAVAYGGAWVAAFAGGKGHSRVTLALVILALLIILASQFIINPRIAALRDEIKAAGETPQLKGRFGAMHRWSVILFGVQWVLAGVALVRHSLQLASRPG